MSVIDRNTSHLAGEFLVAGELARRGYPVSITMGRAKSVDIYAGTQGEIIVDAKALRSKSDWPMKKDAINKDQFYIFVFLQTGKGINENKSPEYFVAKGEELLSKIETWKTRQGIRYSSLKNSKDFENRWGKLPPP